MECLLGTKEGNSSAAVASLEPYNQRISNLVVQMMGNHYFDPINKKILVVCTNLEPVNSKRELDQLIKNRSDSRNFAIFEPDRYL